MRQAINGPPAQAAPWLAIAAEHDITEAQTRYGQLLLEGKDIGRDPEEALKWFRRAAQADDAMAMNMVGRCHENGWGTPPDMVVATYWFKLAAERGLDWGMYNYATSLALGRGTPVNLDLALTWLQKAAGLGHAKSCNLLGGFYEDGWSVAVDLETAFALYGKAAHAGDFRGQFNFARMLVGRGRLDEARDWLKRVAETATPEFLAKAKAFFIQTDGPPKP